MQKFIRTALAVSSIAMLSAALLFTMSACKDKSDKDENVSKKASSQLSSQVANSKATNSQTEVTSMADNFKPSNKNPSPSGVTSTITDDITPISELKKYTLVIPNEWLEKVDYIEDGNVVKVFHRQSRAKYLAGTSDYDGLLFTIISMSQDDYDAKFSEVPGEIVGEMDGTVAVWIKVTDVRADPEDMDMFNDYMQMTGNVEAMMDTLRFWPD